MASRPGTGDGPFVPGAHLLDRFVPVAFGAALSVAVVGVVTAPVLDDQAPFATGERRFEVIDEPITAPPVTAPVVTAVPPADIASVLVDLTPRGFTAIPPAAPFGPLPDAEAAALMDSADDGGEPTIETLAGLLRRAGFTRGHANVWQGEGEVVAATIVLEFAEAGGAAQYGGDMTEMLGSDPRFITIDAGVTDGYAGTARTEDGAGGLELFQAHAVRGGRVYRVLVIDPSGDPVDVELGRSLLAEQAAVG